MKEFNGDNELPKKANENNLGGLKSLVRSCDDPRENFLRNRNKKLWEDLEERRSKKIVDQSVDVSQSVESQTSDQKSER